ELREVASVLAERLVRRLGIGRRDALVAAHALEPGHEALAREADVAEGGQVVAERGEEDVLDAHVLVLERPHLLLGLREHLSQALRDVRLAGWAGRRTPHLRPAVELALERLAYAPRRDAGQVEQVRRETALLIEQGDEQVLDVDALVVPPRGDRARLLQ